jgi:hypothetical protein
VADSTAPAMASLRGQPEVCWVANNAAMAIGGDEGKSQKRLTLKIANVLAAHCGKLVIIAVFMDLAPVSWIGTPRILAGRANSPPPP